MVAHVWFDYGSIECYLAWKRLAGRTDVAWNPLPWPGSAVDGTLAARGHLVAQADGREGEWMRLAFEAQWVHGRGIHRPETLAAIATKAGIDSLAARIDAPAVAAQLEGIRLEARLHGVTALPAVLAGGALATGVQGVTRLVAAPA